MATEIELNGKDFNKFEIEIKVVYSSSFRIKLWIMKLWTKIVMFGYHCLDVNIVCDEQIGIGVLYDKSTGKELHE